MAAKESRERQRPADEASAITRSVSEVTGALQVEAPVSSCQGAPRRVMIKLQCHALSVRRLCPAGGFGAVGGERESICGRYARQTMVFVAFRTRCVCITSGTREAGAPSSLERTYEHRTILQFYVINVIHDYSNHKSGNVTALQLFADILDADRGSLYTAAGRTS